MGVAQMMPKIIFEVIPHEKQRYNTVGDYWRDEDGVWHFQVSDAKNPDFEFLVFIHELVEWYRTEKGCIPEPAISEFDEQFEEETRQGMHALDDEPGDDPRAPYYKEHQIATGFERMMCAILGVDWDQYEDTYQAIWRGTFT
jgi:hypothetical protein